MRLKGLQITLATIVTGIGVAITYYYFEAAAHGAIDAVWADWLNTDDRRLLVVPTCVVLSLVYFGLQHRLDPQSEKRESHGLGDAPEPTIMNFAKVLAIGFLSLVAGASLGPEAILVPACMILGGYIGKKSFGSDKQAARLLGMAGFIALLAAFFNSFLAGMLGLLLVSKQTGLKLKPSLLIIAAIAAGSTVWVLGLLKSSAFVSLPKTNWGFSVRGLLALVMLALAGYLVTYAIGWSHRGAEHLHRHVKKRDWWLRALAAALGLSVLYLLGGPLVEFTGNNSVVPMLQRTAELGVVGLLWITIVKIAAISWSKAMGYRGGLIFPTVFIASVLVAIAHTIAADVNFIYGLIAVMVGVIGADQRVKILF